VKLAELRTAASHEMVLWLPRVEAHGAGLAVGLASAVLGFGIGQTDLPGRTALAWLCLAGVMAGMWMQWRWKKADSGWRVDFGQRRVEPVSVRGQAVTIEGEGWSIQTSPGDRRSSVAIDLRHADVGRVARLLDVPSPRKAELAELSALADTIAARLTIARTGPQI
jgi:hypothetical protein